MSQINTTDPRRQTLAPEGQTQQPHESLTQQRRDRLRASMARVSARVFGQQDTFEQRQVEGDANRARNERAPERSITYGEHAPASRRDEKEAAKQWQAAFGGPAQPGHKPAASRAPRINERDIAAMYPHIQQNPGSLLHQALRAGFERPVSPPTYVIPPQESLPENHKRKSHEADSRPDAR